MDYGDWDMHAGLGRFDGGWMAAKLTELAQALSAFHADLGEAMASTTVMTLSEFGRRAGENGSGGLDHGHGNLVLMMGGGVVGGRVHGRWPGMSDAALDDGALAGTTGLPLGGRGGAHQAVRRRVPGRRLPRLRRRRPGGRARTLSRAARHVREVRPPPHPGGLASALAGTGTGDGIDVAAWSDPAALSAVATAAAVLVVPGLAVGAVLRLRGLVLAATAPPVSVAVVATSAVVAGALGVGWGLLPPLTPPRWPWSPRWCWPG